MAARELAAAAGITSEYMCEIEKGRKVAVSEGIMEKMIQALMLTEEETALFYDLAAVARKTVSVSADLPEYIMAHELVRTALRTAKKHQIPDEKWEKFIQEMVREG
jgi:transcriptional regulator with XRE-family HTH domain